MIYLADTNVAARRILTSDPAHEEVKRAVDTLLRRGDLVAVMLAHGVTHLLTLNPTHFRRFSDLITIVEPTVV